MAQVAQVAGANGGKLERAGTDVWKKASGGDWRVARERPISNDADGPCQRLRWPTGCVDGRRQAGRGVKRASGQGVQGSPRERRLKSKPRTKDSGPDIGPRACRGRARWRPPASPGCMFVLRRLLSCPVVALHRVARSGGCPACCWLLASASAFSCAAAVRVEIVDTTENQSHPDGPCFWLSRPIAAQLSRPHAQQTSVHSNSCRLSTCNIGCLNAIDFSRSACARAGSAVVRRTGRDSKPGRQCPPFPSRANVSASRASLAASSALPCPPPASAHLLCASREIQYSAMRGGRPRHARGHNRVVDKFFLAVETQMDTCDASRRRVGWGSRWWARAR
ncbi:hypothetical protein ANO11243_011720 [Dothideomycetidae sp. 11243]|nr:hypothetical protein ANO11243_011720 [fungal sp. No.11243]